MFIVPSINCSSHGMINSQKSLKDNFRMNYQSLHTLTLECLASYSHRCTRNVSVISKKGKFVNRRENCASPVSYRQHSVFDYRHATFCCCEQLPLSRYPVPNIYYIYIVLFVMFVRKQVWVGLHSLVASLQLIFINKAWHLFLVLLYDLFPTKILMP